MKKMVIMVLAISFLITTSVCAVTYELVDPNTAKNYDAQITATDTQQVQTIETISVNSIDAEIAKIDNVISGINSQLTALQGQKTILEAKKAAIISQFKLTEAVEPEPIGL